jgi:ABC-type dipeptide/oligopeptide/nickel transport system permease subunit
MTDTTATQTTPTLRSLLAESPILVVGLSILGFWLTVAIFAPWIAPFGPNENLVPMALPGDRTPDGRLMLLGADHLGRDVLSRMIYGGRTVLTYAPLATLCAYSVGVTLGLIAGYKGRWIDELLSRFADLVLAFPVIVLYIVIIQKFGASGLNILIAVTLASSPGIMRLVRGVVLDLRTRAYVSAAQMRGESTFYILFVEILPNARGPLIVDACLRLGYVTITIGTLGFLGLGIPPPTPDWGSMINEARHFALVFPHMAVFPCLAVSSLVLAFNLIADGLREISLAD